MISLDNFGIEKFSSVGDERTNMNIQMGINP